MTFGRLPETIRPCDLSQSDADAWRAMQAATPVFGSPLLGPDFARAVGEVRSDARVSIWRKASGAPAAILAHHRRPGGFARPIGAPLSDYQALLSSPDVAMPATDALASAGLGALRLSGLIDPFGAFDADKLQASPAHRIVLEGPASAYLQRVREASSNASKNQRRYSVRLERDLGSLQIAAPDLDQAAFERLLAWKRRQLERSGLHDFLRAQSTGALTQRLFDTRGDAFEGLMISLYAGDRHVAGQFGVRQGDWYHPWIAAFDPELRAYSPGFLHQWKAIEAMPGLGLRTYDLGTSSDRWKQVFASETVLVGAGMVTADNLSGRIALASEQVWALGPLRRHPLAGRVRRRLDQLAAMEPTLGGRVRGVMEAAMNLDRRIAATEPAEAAPPAQPHAAH